jgi:hypothetical protein
MAAANPLWRAPRIHGELKMLGIAISERTVSRLLRKLRRPPNQTWKTFLHTHVGQMVSTDFFTVPTFNRDRHLSAAVYRLDNATARLAVSKSAGCKWGSERRN